MTGGLQFGSQRIGHRTDCGGMNDYLQTVDARLGGRWLRQYTAAGNQCSFCVVISQLRYHAQPPSIKRFAVGNQGKVASAVLAVPNPGQHVPAGFLSPFSDGLGISAPHGCWSGIEIRPMPLLVARQ